MKWAMWGGVQRAGWYWWHVQCGGLPVGLGTVQRLEIRSWRFGLFTIWDPEILVSEYYYARTSLFGKHLEFTNPLVGKSIIRFKKVTHLLNFILPDPSLILLVSSVFKTFNYVATKLCSEYIVSDIDMWAWFGFKECVGGQGVVCSCLNCIGRVLASLYYLLRKCIPSLLFGINNSCDVVVSWSRWCYIA